MPVERLTKDTTSATENWQLEYIVRQRSLKAAILLYSSFLMTMFTTKSKTFEQEGVYTTNTLLHVQDFF